MRRRAPRSSRRTRKWRPAPYVPRQPNIVGSGQLVNLNYASNTNIDPGLVGNVATRVYRATDLFDPDLTGGGHQPMGFDEWMAFYNHFFVSGSKITVEFSARNANVYDQIVGIVLLADSTPILDLDQLMEQKGCVHRMLGSGSSTPPVKLTHTFSHRKFFADSPMSDKYLGNATSSPVENAFFHVFCAPVQAVDASAIDISVKLNYSARMIERRALGLS